MKVRLGPISLQYRGSGRFIETDEAAHRTVIEATGTASGGQSTAAATVTASLAENGEGTAVTAGGAVAKRVVPAITALVLLALIIRWRRRRR